MKFQHISWLVPTIAVSANAKMYFRRKLQEGTLAEVLAEDDNVATTFSLFNDTGLIALLDDPEADPKLTLFAPINSAYEDLDAELLARVTEDGFEAHLEKLLLLHVALGAFNSTDLLETRELTTASADTLTVEAEDDAIRLIAPSSSATVEVADTLAVNGVAHQIDSVLLPAFWDLSIEEVAATLEGYDIFNEFLNMVNLESLLPDNTTVATVLAPDDAAFLALGEDVLEFLRAPSSRTALEALLQNHIIAGSVPFRDLVNGTITLVSGQTRTVTRGPGGKVTIGNAKVIAPDVLANDGIIHGIDEVLTFPDTADTAAPIDTPATPESTVAPGTSAPTEAPVTEAPTEAPGTVAPTEVPATPVTTEAPATPAPTEVPATPEPTEAPIDTTPVPKGQTPTDTPVEAPTEKPEEQDSKTSKAQKKKKVKGESKEKKEKSEKKIEKKKKTKSETKSSKEKMEKTSESEDSEPEPETVPENKPKGGKGSKGKKSKTKDDE